MALSLNSILSFGKHDGETIEEVLKKDPSYIEWALEEIEWFELDDTAMKKYEEEIEWFYYEDERDWYAESWRDGHPMDYGDR